MGLANRLTMLRMLLVPVFIGCFYLKISWYPYLAAGVFVLAYATDMLDGYIARSRNTITDFGKLMDPIADKLLSASALIMLTAQGMLHPVAAIIIVARVVFISGFRLVSAGCGKVIAASSLGKLKTISQFLAITLVLLHDWVGALFGFALDSWVLWLSVALTLLSAIDYVQKNKGVINLG
jgi:CDP-diacylglycerol--glycerol-3-phosphate 3-phosphatidyltransferase